MNKRELEGLYLTYLSILIDKYAQKEIPKGTFKLSKDGTVTVYFCNPQWFARATRKYKHIPFLELCKILYDNILYERLGKRPAETQFSQLFYEGDYKKLVEVLFMLHFCEELKPIQVNSFNNTDLESGKRLAMIREEYNNPAYKRVIDFADGPYELELKKVRIVVDEHNNPISLQELANRVI